jgi:hypothetical protein
MEMVVKGAAAQVERREFRIFEIVVDFRASCSHLNMCGD